MTNTFSPAVEFDFSGGYLAVAGSDTRYVIPTTKFAASDIM